MHTFKRKLLGVTLFEVMLVLLVASMISVAVIKYTQRQTEMAAAVVYGENLYNYGQAVRQYVFNSSNLYTNGYLPGPTGSANALVTKSTSSTKVTLTATGVKWLQAANAGTNAVTGQAYLSDSFSVASNINPLVLSTPATVTSGSPSLADSTLTTTVTFDTATPQVPPSITITAGVLYEQKQTSAGTTYVLKPDLTTYAINQANTMYSPYLGGAVFNFVYPFAQDVTSLSKYQKNVQTLTQTVSSDQQAVTTANNAVQSGLAAINSAQTNVNSAQTTLGMAQNAQRVDRQSLAQLLLVPGTQSQRNALTAKINGADQQAISDAQTALTNAQTALTTAQTSYATAWSTYNSAQSKLAADQSALSAAQSVLNNATSLLVTGTLNTAASSDIFLKIDGSNSMIGAINFAGTTSNSNINNVIDINFQSGISNINQLTNLNFTGTGSTIQNLETVNLVGAATINNATNINMINGSSGATSTIQGVTSLNFTGTPNDATSSNFSTINNLDTLNFSQGIVNGGYWGNGTITGMVHSPTFKGIKVSSYYLWVGGQRDISMGYHDACFLVQQDSGQSCGVDNNPTYIADGGATTTHWAQTGSPSVATFTTTASGYYTGQKTFYLHGHFSGTCAAVCLDWSN